jgi:hypothetical protein
MKRYVLDELLVAAIHRLPCVSLAMAVPILVFHLEPCVSFSVVLPSL